MAAWGWFSEPQEEMEHGAGRWVGRMLVDRHGVIRQAAGMAGRWVDSYGQGRIEATPFAELFARIVEIGPQFARIGSWRASGGLIDSGEGVYEIIVLAADEEERLSRLAIQRDKEGRAMEKLAKALVSSASLDPLCLAAVHAVTSSLDLFAAFIWIEEDKRGLHRLTASAGVERSRLEPVKLLGPDGPPCAAWLAASQGRGLFLTDLMSNRLCAALEGEFLGGKPAGLFLAPLKEGDRTIGVLEMIARPGDAWFAESRGACERAASLISMAVVRALDFDAMERKASFDPLTGIANHRTLQEFLGARLNECRRTGKPLSVVMVDVDHFRAFNEEYGHSAGDTVLKKVAEVLRGAIRPYDLAARYGGEEFTLVLPGAELDEARAVAERIRLMVEDLDTGLDLKATASFGCAVFPDAAEEASALLKVADAALYRAKRSGRNRVCSYTGGSDGGDQAIDLSDFALSQLDSETRAMAHENLEAAEPFLLSLQNSLGLRLGHVEALRTAIALLPAWQEGGMSRALSHELHHGQLRGILPLLQSVAPKSELKSNEGLNAAFWLLAQEVMGGRFGPESDRDLAPRVPAA